MIRAGTLRQRAFALLGIMGLAAAAAFGSGAVQSTLASWNDVEWAGSRVGVLDCTAPDSAAGHGWGRLITGALGEAALDPVLALDGIEVRNDGSGAVADPTDAAGVGGDPYAFRVPIDLSLLRTRLLALGLGLPLELGTGVYDQYARAAPAGAAAGASGAVTDGGAIDLDAVEAGTAPRLGALRISQLPGAGAALGANVTDLALEIGAVAASAEGAGCEWLWSGAEAAGIDRRYLVSGLDLALRSPLVAGFSSTAVSSITALQGTLNALVTGAENSLASALVSQLTSVLGGLLGALRIGTITATAEIELDVLPVASLLSGEITDGVVTIDLGAGELRADLAALLGEVHADSDGLNGRAPNTVVLSAPVLEALLGRVDSLLEALVEDVQQALEAALLGATVTLSADIRLQAFVLVAWINVLGIDLDISTTVAGLLGRPGAPAPSVQLTHTVLGGSLGAGLIASLLSGLSSGITGTVLPALGTVLNTALFGPATTAITTTVGGLTSLAAGLVAALDPVLDRIAQVVRISLNARPDAPPHPSAPEHPDDPALHSVSALRVAVLDGGGGTQLLELLLATAAAGAS